ncbi:MAG: aldo/keto reductase [Candidatus Thorarchaeota archaeon]
MPSVKIPRIGLGTWESKDPRTTPQSIAKAIQMGYRHIDTAQLYFNEELVGLGIRESGISREELFLATKISPSYLQPDDLKRMASESLNKLGVDFVDLLYIHWPAETYEPEVTLIALNEVMEEGLTKHIAVSNFTPPLLDEALAISKNDLIANQVEMHPLLQQREMVEYTKNHDMYLVAYSPLGRGLIHDIPEVKEIAERQGISTAQVCLAWLLSKDNVLTIPKASSEQHQRENLEALDVKLAPSDIQLIESITDEERIVDPYFAPDW